MGFGTCTAKFLIIHGREDTPKFIWIDSYVTTIGMRTLRKPRSIIFSDRPIVLDVGSPPKPSSVQPFRYFTGWLSHDDFFKMVGDNWIKTSNITETILHFTKAADTWNKYVFGYIGKNKRMIMARLYGIQKALCRRSTQFLQNMESDLLIDLEHLLDQEELLGGKNLDWIGFLWNTDWCNDEDSLKEAAAHFFLSLFALDSQPTGSFPLRGAFSSIPQDTMQRLDDVPSNEKIHSVLMSMTPLKSPGWNGLHAEFFQKQWPIVGDSIYKMIQAIFNWSTYKPLYDAIQDPHEDIVNKLKPLFPTLIGQNQTSFIAGRNITDNIIINQENASLPQQCKFNEMGAFRKPFNLNEVFLNVTPSLPTSLFWTSGYGAARSPNPQFCHRKTICPDASDSDDQPYWGTIIKNTFETRLAYSYLTAHTWDDKLPIWSSIWIWKSRNDKIFNNIPQNGDVTLSRSFTWGRYDAESKVHSMSNHVTPNQQVDWKSPEPGWICLNVDGAVSSTTKHGAIGGVFRDNEGSWILGFNKALGILQPLHAELWAIYVGIQIAWDHGFEFLVIQSDSMEAVNLLNKSHAHSSPLSLVRAIEKLRKQAWVTNIQWIS
ncbi:hypothetical protein F3Y22_tig00110328pilonHSYRG00789 [Hibiscus syriacus]|uniref:RNase H type-1 domain-containing protein n=1 Tax=Hibiscus syriacus TaxID=106335 RepID=A0A6A3B2Q0_HIBSY|nr:hypothetical protein F3Y22_tig00110328pilonHSYRG00789 [Hibiscus syriacus]